MVVAAAGIIFGLAILIGLPILGITATVSQVKKPAIPDWRSALAWTLGGAVYGVLLRGLFGSEQLFQGPMSSAFLLATPFTVGALTIYGCRNSAQGIGEMIARPWASVGLMLLGCALVMLEGSICIAIMSPLFLACGSLGGLAMGLALHLAGTRSAQLPVVAILPFLVVLGEHGSPPTDRELELRGSVIVNAPPEAIWKEILTARSIRPDELPLSLVHLIGVPKPVEGINVATADGEVRFSKWERGVNFRGIVTHREENHSITWRYAFDGHSFPEGSMDEHVAIGGRYFDLHDTTFNLQPVSGGSTELEIVAHYRVTSSINFYAVPVANVLGRDFIATILGLYKGRSERATAAGSASKPTRPSGLPTPRASSS